jgi:hypothetical protein
VDHRWLWTDIDRDRAVRLLAVHAHEKKKHQNGVAALQKKLVIDRRIVANAGAHPG